METNYLKYIVYKTKNKINGKIYVGVHKTTTSKFDGYIGCGININITKIIQNPQTPFHFAINKYGYKNFYRETIFEFNTAKEAYEKEHEIVNCDFINRKDTYNAKIGGKGGSSSQIEVFKFTLDGVCIESFDSIVDAAMKHGCSDTAIRNAIKSKGSCSGFYWAKTNSIKTGEFHAIYKCIYMYDSDGNFEQKFCSVKDAATFLKVTGQSISAAIHRLSMIRGHYFSEYYAETFKIPQKISIRNKYIKIYFNGEFVCKKHTSELYDFFHIKTLNSIMVSIKSGKPYKGYIFQIINDIV